MTRFSRRLVSAAAMWAIALLVLFTGNETIFVLLIGSLGLAGLWEYFQMIERSGMRCFKVFGMACGAASFIGSFLALRTYSQTAAYDFENFVVLVFLFGVFARQMFRPTGKTCSVGSDGLHPLWINVCGLVVQFYDQDHLRGPEDATGSYTWPILRPLSGRGDQVQRYGCLPCRVAGSGGTR